MVPKPLIYVAVCMSVMAMLPPAVIAIMRAKPDLRPRIHFIQDMDNQHSLGAQDASMLFNDGRAMRPVVEGTVARGELSEDDHYTRGVVGGNWATTFPSQVTVDMALMYRGQERFNIYCSVCHDKAGYGLGSVHLRAMDLMTQPPERSNGTSWVAPKSLHEAAIAEQPVGQIYNTVTHGIRNMAGYADQVPTADRWAIVAYVKALQRSQKAKRSDVPDPEVLPSVRTPFQGAADTSGGGA